MQRSGDPHGDVHLLAEFRYVLRRFLHFSEEAAVQRGLTPQQHQLLLQVAGAPAGTHLTVGYLAERLALRHHSAVELAVRTEEAGLLLRHRNQENRREVMLALSPRGGALLQQLNEAHARQLHELGPDLIALLQQLMAQVPPPGGHIDGAAEMGAADV